MNLSELIKYLPIKQVVAPVPDDAVISGIAYDSRLVQKGYLFVAFPGQHSDGHDYVDQAIKQGAVAVVAERSIAGLDIRVPYVVTINARAALATLAAAYYGFPARRLHVIGVTGTDGKTTTTTLIHAILTAAGITAGMLTTIGGMVGEELLDTGTHVTTPDALQVQAFLSHLLDKGADYAVLETTSHALIQHRVQECAFDVAVITNVTHEHLDYHGTLDAYRQAKGILFHSLLTDSFRKPNTPKMSILNADDPSFDYFRSIAADLVLSYGIESSADFTASNIAYTSRSTRFSLSMPDGTIDIEMALLGEHNVYNALAALATCYSQGVRGPALQAGLAAVHRLSGRLEQVDIGQDFQVFVDFAHTPNSLEQTLRAAREFTRGRVILVFGLSGGARDKTKRPVMGEIAGRLADKIVITAVDWYEDEEVQVILSQIATGLILANRKEHEDYYRVPDRRAGILRAVRMAQPGDVVIVAGKGHEGSLSVRGVEQPWSEVEVAKQAIQDRLLDKG